MGGATIWEEPSIQPESGFCLGAPDNRRCFESPDFNKVTLKASDLQQK